MRAAELTVWGLAMAYVWSGLSYSSVPPSVIHLSSSFFLLVSLSPLSGFCAPHTQHSHTTTHTLCNNNSPTVKSARSPDFEHTHVLVYQLSPFTLQSQKKSCVLHCGFQSIRFPVSQRHFPRYIFFCVLLLKIQCVFFWRIY